MVIYIHTYKHTCIQNSQMRLALGTGNTGFSCMKNQLSLGFAAIKYKSYILAFKLKLLLVIISVMQMSVSLYCQENALILSLRISIHFHYYQRFVEHFCMKYYTNARNI